jgi:hypothetical protein
MEQILDKRVGKKTRRKEYFEYLVKWKDHPVEDASWETEAEILKHVQTVQELLDRIPCKFSSEGVLDAGAPPRARALTRSFPPSSA